MFLRISLTFVSEGLWSLWSVTAVVTSHTSGLWHIYLSAQHDGALVQRSFKTASLLEHESLAVICQDWWLQSTWLQSLRHNVYQTKCAMWTIWCLLTFCVINILQGSVATYLRSGGIFIHNFNINLLMNLLMKKNSENRQYLAKLWFVMVKLVDRIYRLSVYWCMWHVMECV